jgi:hypothetical protein
MLKRSEELLVKAGFEIILPDSKVNIIAKVNNQDHFSSLVAECLVIKDKKKYVVVVKQGAEAFDINEINTRRKLIEYSAAFGLWPIIVIEPEAGELSTVNFRFLEEKGVDYFMKIFSRLFVAVVIIGIIWLFVYLRII